MRLKIDGRGKLGRGAKTATQQLFKLARFADLTVELPVGTPPLVLRCTNKRELRRAATLFTKEPITVSLLSGEVRPGDVVWDIGANIGLYTLVAAQAAGQSGRVVAFEPMAANFARLIENVTLNGFGGRVLPVSTPLSDAAAVTRLFYRDASAGATGAQVHEPVWVSDQRFEPAIVEVKPTARADTLVQEGFLPTPHVVKLDVDGHEPAILKGMSGILSAADKPRAVLVEVNPGQDSEIEALMTEAGYRLDQREATASGQARIDKGEDRRQISFNTMFRPA